METVDLVQAGPQHLDLLRRLVQLYLYDFSEVLCGDPDGELDERGLFDPGFDVARYLHAALPGQPCYWAYLARVGGRWVGFALVSDRIDREHHAGPGLSVDEFFVLRCYRRRGIGRALAEQVFDRHRGYWQVTVIEPNRPAQAFWRSVVRTLTGGQFRAFETLEGGQIVYWYVFDNSRVVPGLSNDAPNNVPPGR